MSSSFALFLPEIVYSDKNQQMSINYHNLFFYYNQTIIIIIKQFDQYLFIHYLQHMLVSYTIFINILFNNRSEYMRQDLCNKQKQVAAVVILLSP